MDRKGIYTRCTPCYSPCLRRVSRSRKKGRGGEKGGERRRKTDVLEDVERPEPRRECAISSDCYFAALEFTQTGAEDEITESDGLLCHLLPRNDTLRGYNSPDRPTVSRPILLRVRGTHEIRFRSYSSSLFFLEETGEQCLSAKCPRRYLILEIVGRGAINHRSETRSINR